MKKTYDLEMIKDFMEHLGWELRIKHFESTHERETQKASTDKQSQNKANLEGKKCCCV